VSRSINHYQDRMENLLERNIGIEKYFSYIVLKSPIVKNALPLKTPLDNTQSVREQFVPIATIFVTASAGEERPQRSAVVESAVLEDVCFSNRPLRVKRLRTIHRCVAVDDPHGGRAFQSCPWGV